MCCLGQKAVAMCQRMRFDLVASAIQLGDLPVMERLIGPLEVLFN